MISKYKIKYYNLFMIFLLISCSQKESNQDQLKILTWGPQNKVIGEVPNIQPNGDIGLWIEVSGKSKDSYSVIFNDKQLETVNAAENLITAAIPIGYTESIGEKDIYIEEIGSNNKIFVGKFITRNPD
jgi:hypothetical protein